jgi:hypothetical protein
MGTVLAAARDGREMCWSLPMKQMVPVMTPVLVLVMVMVTTAVVANALRGVAQQKCILRTS